MASNQFWAMAGISLFASISGLRDHPDFYSIVTGGNFLGGKINPPKDEADLSIEH
jgi:hypothetical protein